MRVQSSAKRASRMILSIVFILALRRRRSKRDPSSLHYVYILEEHSTFDVPDGMVEDAEYEAKRTEKRAAVLPQQKM
ncbi:hypothetical protein RRG08_055949 [Elysia crispata]|uniref:Uncharacterized protein n=1 Tax=Elysia crispata TaxID=231223 RepID=A0AAE1AHJ8_9GAST|nr:hypothetical protein RRG08_055949 [Elysia crispata]